MPVLQTLQDARPINQGFYVWQLFLPQDGTLVPKHVGDAPLIFVLIKIGCLVGVTNGVPSDGAVIPRQNRNLLAADRMVL
jgi:hypothetical protein